MKETPFPRRFTGPFLGAAGLLLLGAGALGYRMLGGTNGLREPLTSVEGLAAVLLCGVAGFALFREARGRLAAETELWRQNAVLQSVVSNVAGGVVVADENARFVVFNPAAEGILGFGAAGSGPEQWAEHYGVFLPDRRTRFPTDEFPLVRALRGEDTDEQEQFIRNPRRPQGVFIRATGRPLRDAAGRIRGAVVLFRDVTAEKDAADRIEQLNGELHAKVAELSALNGELEAFSYSVSHDLRAPLRHVHGFVDLLRKRLGDGLDDKARRYLDVVAGSARHMGELIDDLLAFSRMARAELRVGSVDLGVLAAEVVTEVAREAAGRELEWVLEPLPEMVGDRAMLRLALVNLLSNAVKYTRPRPRARIEVGAQPGGNGQVIVYVRDNGVGFDMRYVDKLFGVFQRLHRSEDFEGTGIGLATVRRVVQRHGGTVWAEGVPDGGATLYMSLPRFPKEVTPWTP